MTSKYQSKKKQKAGKAPVKARVPDVPVFLYHSQCCGELAKKDPCAKDPGVPFHERKASLGKWHCTKCRKACKVNRRLNKEGFNPFRPVVASASNTLATLLAVA